jgi:hypothetical protein
LDTGVDGQTPAGLNMRENWTLWGQIRDVPETVGGIDYVEELANTATPERSVKQGKSA